MKHLPNSLSLLRMVGAVALLLSDVSGVLFGVLYIVCGISDIADGWLGLGAVMQYALTIGLGLAFTLAGCYALSATGDIRHLPLTRLAIITVDLFPRSRHHCMVLLAGN